MSVPRISDISASGICSYLIDEVGSLERVSLVRQIFRGDFCGETVTVFPECSESVLIGLTDHFDGCSSPDWKIEEILLELGNIIVGACMGKIAELLNTMFSYNVPQLVLKKTPIDQLCSHDHGGERRVLVIENVLSIEGKETRIYLFIIVGKEALDWLYKTLDRSLESLYI
jgi:chemotaxis protein CheC